jgi:hypothetical protein
MKKLILSFFAFGIISSGISQAVSDRNTIPVAVNLNRVLRMSINTGGNLEFTFNTINQYKNGISGDQATSTSQGTIAANPMYRTTFTVSSSTDWLLEYGAEDAALQGVDDPTKSLTLDNVGFSLSSVNNGAGGHDFTGGAGGGDLTLQSLITTHGTTIAALTAYPTTLIEKNAQADAAGSNAGDASDNSFQMIWRIGTAEGTMNAVKLIEANATPDRYVTNVLFNLQAQ